MIVAGILLAAGLSRRFGADDKLAMAFDGEAIGLRAAKSLALCGVAPLIAVMGNSPLDYGMLGFALHRNPRPEHGQSGSVAIGVAAARAAGADAVLIALADMPLVSPAHLRRVLATGTGRDARVASIAAGRLSPPALFGAGWFPALESLSGDRGARALLDGAVPVPASPHELADVDTLGDLERLKGSGG